MYRQLLPFGHAFGQRYELPIPLLLFVLGGAGIVLISFLIVLQRKVKVAPTQEYSDITHLPQFSRLWAVISLVSLLIFVLTGLYGSQEVAENIVPTLFWLVVWIAAPLACAVVGDFTRQLNPFLQIARIFDSPNLRRWLIARVEPMAWPVWLSWWPAVALFFVLATGELIFNQTATLPVVTAVGAVIYAVISAVMGLLYGNQWAIKGEVFSVLFSTWGRLGWFRFGNTGTSGLAGGLAHEPFEPAISRIIFVVLLLVNVGLDGLLSTPFWSKFAYGLPAAISFGTTGYRLFATVVFAALAVIFVALLYLFARAVAYAGAYSSKQPRVVLAGLLSSLLPISFGYLLAHNIQYLLVNGQLLFPLIGNPIGSKNWPLHFAYPFNDSFDPNLQVLPSSFYWYLSVIIIIAVHIMAVVLAHRHLGSKATSKEHARRSEYPWVFAMITYTMLSLWLLAQPLVKDASTATVQKLLYSGSVAMVETGRRYIH